nr:MAG TPA: hypothetical protein [Caudoviricetes sp.]
MNHPKLFERFSLSISTISKVFIELLLLQIFLTHSHGIGITAERRSPG